MDEATYGSDTGNDPGIEWAVGIEVSGSETGPRNTQVNINIQADVPPDLLSDLPLAEPLTALASEITQYKADCDAKREEERRERERKRRTVVDDVFPASAPAYQPRRGRGGREFRHKG